MLEDAGTKIDSAASTLLTDYVSATCLGESVSGWSGSVGEDLRLHRHGRAPP
ncbi:MAG TPA: hypothetical protein VEF71_13890 [Streptosporangiaceae bacterium]|nr:hypothetical protein [Streptosporangiaceae bacterium]